MTVRETERKYESGEPPDAELIAALAAAAAARVAPPRATADRPVGHLLGHRGPAAGCARGSRCAAASGAATRAGTSSCPPGPDSRDEVRRPLGRSRKPPAPLVALSRAAHRGRTAAARRRARHGPPGVDADRRAGRGRRHRHRRPGHRPAPSAPGPTAARPWTPSPSSGPRSRSSWPGTGTPEVLDRIEDALLRAGVHRSASASKLGRVLAERFPPGPPRPVAGPDATAGEVVLAYCGEQAETIRATDPQVRRDAPEAVHAMRVACRRMRSTFQSFRALLDRSRHRRPRRGAALARG